MYITQKATPHGKHVHITAATYTTEFELSVSEKFIKLAAEHTMKNLTAV
jgi:hypothetical protein